LTEGHGHFPPQRAMTRPFSNQPTHLWLTDSLPVQQADLGLPRDIPAQAVGAHDQFTSVVGTT
jgi:hypothetical protein